MNYTSLLAFRLCLTSQPHVFFFFTSSKTFDDLIVSDKKFIFVVKIFGNLSITITRAEWIIIKDPTYI